MLADLESSFLYNILLLIGSLTFLRLPLKETTLYVAMHGAYMQRQTWGVVQAPCILSWYWDLGLTGRQIYLVSVGQGPAYLCLPSAGLQAQATMPGFLYGWWCWNTRVLAWRVLYWISNLPSSVQKPDSYFVTQLRLNFSLGSDILHFIVLHFYYFWVQIFSNLTMVLNLKWIIKSKLLKKCFMLLNFIKVSSSVSLWARHILN